MTQDINTDRDAINPQALAEAITLWRCDRSVEADIALDAALLAQGVISPEEAVAEVTPVREGSSEIVGINVVIEAYMFEQVTLFINRDGEVRIVD